MRLGLNSLAQGTARLFRANREAILEILRLHTCMATTKQAMFNTNAEEHDAPIYPNGSVKGAGTIETEATDIQRWRLLDERGRQTWHYLDSEDKSKEWPQTTADRYFLGLDLVGRQSLRPSKPQGIG